jgi:UDP-N-acetylmuramoylalanine--D-glutamate ligase
MILNKQKNKKIGIFGLGITGISAFNALKDCANVICFDDSVASQETFKINYSEDQLVPIQDAKWTKLDKIILSPNIPLEYPKKHPVVEIAERYNIELSSDFEIFHEEFSEACFIGITGTNGKSTTTALTGHILNICNKRFQIGGNIGKACLTLDPPYRDAGYVFELSSFQIDLLKNFHLQVAILLNITPDHIDRHGNFENYFQSKNKILSFLNKEGVAILAIDNENTFNIYNSLKDNRNDIKIIPISVNKRLDNGIYIELQAGKRFICDNAFDKGNKYEIILNKYLQGNHNLENMLASFAATRSVGCKADDILQAISSFQGLPHRMQFAGELGNLKFYNDSKATNAESAEKSLSSLENIFWLAGGLPKEGGIQSLIYLKDKIRKAYLFGKAAEEFAKTLEGHIDYVISSTMDEAFTEALADAREFEATGRSGNILLAPACASWDQFKNFEERGNKFVELVKKYINLRKNI